MRTSPAFRQRAVAVVAATVVGLSLAGCADDAPGAPLASGRGPAAAVGEVVEFVASEFAFAPMSLTLEPGVYHGVLRNDGSIEHDIVFDDGTRAVAASGAAVDFEFVVPDGGTEFLCSIPGHADSGMKGVITTPGSVTPAAADDPASHGGTNTVETEPDPAAPPIEIRDPRVPARGEGEGFTLVPGGAPDGGDLIEVEMVIEEKLMTIAEGYQQLVWTFNGELPGPVIRTQVGDTVRVHLVNPPDAQVSHSVDFHASQVAWNDEMRSIAPGEDLVYEFTTDYAGVWMYHCGTAPVLHHIANGMFGMVIVEPEAGLDPVDHEFFFVQNEWYLGPQGETSSLAKANVGAPAPDFVMFNGVASQYVDEPIEVATGGSVRLFVLDAGPSIDSSFHIVGTIFDTVIKEGVALTRGNDGNWGAQAVDLSPAQGAVIEFTTAEDGLYPIVTHAFNFPGRGALGLLKAGDGEP